MTIVTKKEDGEIKSIIEIDPSLIGNDYYNKIVNEVIE